MSCCRPLFERTPGCYDQTYPAYIAAECNGKMYQGIEYNNGCCEREFNGYQESFRIPENLRQGEIDDLIEKIRPLAKGIFENKEDGGQRMYETDPAKCDSLRAAIRQVIEDVDTDFDTCEDPECRYCNEIE